MYYSCICDSVFAILCGHNLHVYKVFNPNHPVSEQYLSTMYES